VEGFLLVHVKVSVFVYLKKLEVRVRSNRLADGRVCCNTVLTRSYGTLPIACLTLHAEGYGSHHYKPSIW